MTEDKKMEKHKELLNEFEHEFEKIKKELNFKATLQELDEIFFLKDFVLQTGFLSPRLSRMMCSRIKDTLSIWGQQLQAWLTPNPYSIISIGESQAFTDSEKEEMNKIMRKILSLTSDNMLVGLTKNKENEAKFIDDSLAFWKENLPHLIRYTEKMNHYWKTPEPKQRREQN